MQLRPLGVKASWAWTVALALAVTSAKAADDPSRDARGSRTDAAAGKALFQRHCAECHAPGFGHPGTQQLGWTRGEARAVLEKRTDLQPAYITAVVRNGLLEMPAFRPTQISDTELRQIAAYLSRTAPR